VIELKRSDLYDCPIFVPQMAASLLTTLPCESAIRSGMAAEKTRKSRVYANQWRCHSRRMVGVNPTRATAATALSVVLLTLWLCLRTCAAIHFVVALGRSENDVSGMQARLPGVARCVWISIARDCRDRFPLRLRANLAINLLHSQGGSRQAVRWTQIELCEGCPWGLTAYRFQVSSSNECTKMALY